MPRDITNFLWALRHGTRKATAAQWAKRYGVTKNTVWQVCKRLNLQGRILLHRKRKG